MAHPPYVWVADCDKRTLTIHTADGAKTYSDADRVDGGELLPRGAPIPHRLDLTPGLLSARGLAH